MMKPLFFAVAALLLLALAPNSVAVTYTYPQLVERITDLDQLARVPQPGETMAMASSYDRHRQYDAANDKYINWGANGDDYGIVRKEGNTSVFADLKGPGCIFRIWSARALEGHVKIYLDGSATPAVDLPFRAYFDGSAKPFDRPELVYKTTPGKQAGGLNNFTPIPFQKSCKIVADPGWGAYYQFDYASFAPGTVVPTFQRDLAPADLAALDRANQILAQRGDSPAGLRGGENTEHVAVQAAPGATTLVANLSGPQAVTALRVNFALPTDTVAATSLLRQLALQITWDDDQHPAVWCPLGDFFAYFAGGKAFQSLPVGLMKDGTFYSYWYMPFASHAKIEIVNDGPTAVAMNWDVSHAPLQQPIANYERFHAKWHRDAFQNSRPDRQMDWTLLTTRGSGRYVGTELHVWNPRGGWWGEGNDKFFVDGEKFPSLLGTGSEDYFGAAWGLAPFDRGLHGLVLEDPVGAHTAVHRWHIPDSVPFQSSFEGDIEKFFLNDRPTLFDCVVYWYLDPKGTDPYLAIPVADRLGYWTPPFVRHEPDALEGEELPILLQQPAGSTRHSDASAFPVGAISGDRFLSWRATARGQKLELGVHVPTAGTYHLIASFLQRGTGGTYQMGLDGNKLGAPVDLYGNTSHGHLPMLQPPPQDFGPVSLTAGDHVLSAEWVGQNAAGNVNPFCDFYLDYIKLVPVK